MLLDSIRALLGRAGAPAGAAGDAPAPPSAPAPDPLHVAACALLLDVAWADGEFTDDERTALELSLARHFGLAADEGRRLVALADAERERSVDHFGFTATLKRDWGDGEKRRLAEAMWGLVLADGTIAEHEHYLTRKIANLLDLPPAELHAAKRAAEDDHAAGGRA